MENHLFGDRVLDTRTAAWNFDGQRVVQSMVETSGFDKTTLWPL